MKQNRATLCDGMVFNCIKGGRNIETRQHFMQSRHAQPMGFRHFQLGVSAPISIAKQAQPQTPVAPAYETQYETFGEGDDGLTQTRSPYKWLAYRGV